MQAEARKLRIDLCPSGSCIDIKRGLKGCCPSDLGTAGPVGEGEGGGAGGGGTAVDAT